MKCPPSHHLVFFPRENVAADYDRQGLLGSNGNHMQTNRSRTAASNKSKESRIDVRRLCLAVDWYSLMAISSCGGP